MADLTIRNLIDRISSGDIRIPAFQRDFVWDNDQVAFLIDSIYKGFPIGTVIFWQTDERLNTEKHLGAFALPEPKRDYPVNYVLDGQQRLTSLFSVFQNDLVPEDNSWVDIYFDLEAAKNPQDTCFFAFSDDEADPKRHFPIKTFFETVAYRTATKDLGTIWLTYHATIPILVLSLQDKTNGKPSRSYKADLSQRQRGAEAPRKAALAERAYMPALQCVG